MTTTELFLALLSAHSTEEAYSAVAAFEGSHSQGLTWHPFGRKNNRGTIEASGDTGRSLVERATNGIDAVLELEHQKHNGTPDCKSPKEAGAAWLGVPPNGLSEMTKAQRRLLAQHISITLEEGEGRDARLVSVRDQGIGLSPEDMPSTILSLSEDNKLQKHYLSGTFGQGGSSTLAACRLCLIASRKLENGPIGFTVVKYLDLPPEQFKTGHYVYLGNNSGVLVASDVDDEQFSRGTLCKHFGYDLDSYNSPIGPNSVYGLLNMVLFDPVLPVWLENKLHKWNRVIKGSRNALNGAIDEGDDGNRGPELVHNMPMFYSDLGAFGRIGIEYWVLSAPSNNNRKPSQAFVNDKRPIVLTSNGQNHAEFSVLAIRKDAELPFLASRLICHINCDNLSPHAKRSLFVSNREEARHGAVRSLILQELIRVLKSDTDLERLNKEAKDDSRREQDETALERMRNEVAKLLRLQGIDLARAGGERSREAGADRPASERTNSQRRALPTIEITEPPTYIRFITEEAPVSFYASQRRYLQIETNANDTYYNNDQNRSRVQVMVVGEGVTVVGQTALKNGRMRVGFVCGEAMSPGVTGKLRVELTRAGQPLLADERSFEVVEQPQIRGTDRRVSIPQFEPIRVEFGSDEWIRLGWPDDRTAIASSAEMSDGMLTIYYNVEFPPLAARLSALEVRDMSLATSFQSRYEIWLCMHSLLMYQDQQQNASGSDESDVSEAQEQLSEEAEREERKRIANLSVMIAAREIALMPASESEVLT